MGIGFGGKKQKVKETADLTDENRLGIGVREAEGRQSLNQPHHNDVNWSSILALRHARGKSSGI